MRSIGLSTCTALAALLSGHAAFAQSVDPAAQAATMDAAKTPAADGLEDIIVTAQRRSEPLQRAAVAVDVVTAGELVAAGVVTATTLNNAVPSLTVQQGGGANNVFFIRGVGNFTLNGYSDPAIAFNVDGVYLGRPTSTTTTFFDLERIEVLKGPQGTLYGRNATGGAINVIPARPRIGDLSASVAAGYGNYDARDVEAVVNAPLGDNAALRVSGKIVDRDGYNRDGTLDDEGEGIRAQLLVEPTEAISLRFAADYSHQGGAGPGGSYLGFVTYTPGSGATATSPNNYTFAPSGLDAFSGLQSPEARAFFGQRTIPGPRINPAPLAYPSLDNDYFGVNAELNWDTGAGTLTVIPAYRKSKLDVLFNGPSFRGGLNDETDTQYSLEARFAGQRLGPIDWLVGGYYFDEKVDARYAFNQYGIIAFQDFDSRTRSYAAFGRVTGHLGDTLRLVAGGRYTKDKKKFDAVAQTLVEACARPPGVNCIGGPSLPVVLRLADVPGGPTVPGVPVPFGTSGNILLFFPSTIDRRINTGRFTYRAAAEFDAGANSLLYAAYETGYRSGGFSIAFGREQFAPEFVDAFTIGSKNRFLDNRLQLNIEAFHWKYRDQQVSHLGLDGRNTSAFFTENIGRSTLMGVDIEGQFLATPNTLLSATVQYLDSKTDSFVYNVPRAGAIPPPTGCTTTSTTDATAQPVFAIDCSGKPAFNSPKWSINAGAQQTIPLDDLKLVLSGSMRYRSNAVIGFEYLAQQRSGNNATFDIQAAFGDGDDRWTLSAFVRNIADRRIRTFVQYSATTGNTISATHAPPRTYGGRVAYKF